MTMMRQDQLMDCSTHEGNTFTGSSLRFCVPCLLTGSSMPCGEHSQDNDAASLLHKGWDAALNTYINVVQQVWFWLQHLVDEADSHGWEGQEKREEPANPVRYWYLQACAADWASSMLQVSASSWPKQVNNERFPCA